MAPDLLPLYHRKIRVFGLLNNRPPLPEGETLGPLMEDFLAGVRFHLAVDREFHSQPFFERFSHGLAQGFQTASGPKGLKLFFPAHLLSEMYFDHLLITRHPGWTDELYQVIRDVGRETLTEFTQGHPLASPQGVNRFVGILLADRFLEDYREPEGLFFRAGRILAKCHQRQLTAEEQQAATGYLKRNGPQVWPDLWEFIGAMRQKASHP